MKIHNTCRNAVGDQWLWESTANQLISNVYNKLAQQKTCMRVVQTSVICRPMVLTCRPIVCRSNVLSITRLSTNGLVDETSGNWKFRISFFQYFNDWLRLLQSSRLLGGVDLLYAVNKIQMNANDEQLLCNDSMRFYFVYLWSAAAEHVLRLACHNIS